ncbi:cysteine-rich receptor-like protein kinase 44 isoform X2 [Salvia miltiorrhiza]|uniref:cysteine-rich receptor-like protein kinase 44 isoform X2 n=1 Tax=Salvia miltiorrhiza TaxID=226208 RepID=UPI0025ABE02B|nr:cysteine-rich receptor-like protein kinase 44 isoform X2 [Salvia miltiorrhiza]
MSLWGNSKVWMILLILLIYFSSWATAQNPYQCTSNGNYTINSTYSANLNALLRSLSVNMSDYGFRSASVGQSTNTVNGLALCRADQTLQLCRDCVESATREVLRSCPNERQAAIWYEFCTLRYSDDPIYRTQTADPTFILRNTQNVTNGTRLREERATLVTDLINQAANGSSQLKVGVGRRSVSDPEYSAIYALVQCTPDFSSEDCRRCLSEASRGYQTYTAQGFRVLNPSCNIRYELSTFYNETRLRELRLPIVGSSPPPTSPPGTNGNNTTPGKKDDSSTKLIIGITVPIGVTLIFIACAIIFIRRRMKRSKAYEVAETADDISNVESLQYDFSSIRAATNDFDDANKLGQGGFGAVYKGKLQTGEEVAVKRLSKDSGQGNMEFKNEVLLVAKLQHRNLVRLLGFSMEGTERALIYEFVQNASLDQFIFDPVKRSQLDWDRRYKIIGGIAKGILYLHEDSRLKIIHRDLKASNVLLDGDMNPKIADFGMARLFKQDETQGNTSKIVGTYGYMSPEYAMHGQYSIKSDVFSFGVLVLEIVSGQRNVCIQNGDSTEDLLTLTWKNWREGTAANMIDPMLMNGAGSVRDMLRCMHVGLLCVQENAANRPSMASVALMLSSSTMTLPVPAEPAFYMASRYGPMDSIFQNSKESNSSEGFKFRTGVSEGSSSVNDVSVTELYPR